MNINEQFRHLDIGLPDHIARKKAFGDFEGAMEMIDGELTAGKGSEAYRACLRVQRELIRRLPEDYPFTLAEAVAFAQKSIPDFSEEEMLRLEKAGRIDWIYIQGVPHYFNRFLENLCETDHAYAVRAGVAEEDGDPDNFARRHELFEAMKEKGSIAHRIRCKASVQIREEHFEKGKRSWPICPSRRNARSSPRFALSASSRRTAFWTRSTRPSAPSPGKR